MSLTIHAPIPKRRSFMPVTPLGQNDEHVICIMVYYLTGEIFHQK